MTRFLPGGAPRYPSIVLRTLALLCLGAGLTGCAPANEEGAPVDTASLSQEDKEDIVAFMQLLSFEGPAGAAAVVAVAPGADGPDR